MRVTINKSTVAGSAIIPPSKSMTIRALVCAALSPGESEIINPLVSDDTNAAAAVLTKIGAVIRKEEDVWKVSGGKLHAAQEDLDCGESATTLRFMTAICSLIPGHHRLVCGPSLSKRPIGSLVEALAKLGVKISTEKIGTAPVVIEGGTFVGGTTDIPGNVSSQFISALLLLSPFAQKGVVIKLTTPLTSKPYILMTLTTLKQFGITVQRDVSKFIVLRQKYVPASVKIDSDWSSASYFLALGAMSKEGILIQNLNLASLQGDRVILDLLRIMGARVRVAGINIVVNYDKLKGIHADLSDCIDLLPTMAMMAAVAKGTTDLIGIQRGRIKESNRVTAVRESLTKLGVTVIEGENQLRITGKDLFREMTDDFLAESDDDDNPEEEFKTKDLVTLSSRGDHRIAMALAVLGAALGNIAVDGAECVSKTFPTFWEEFERVGGQVTTDE
jgi:3-phosphoshikimate 1-carboxyvinyltransferase